MKVLYIQAGPGVGGAKISLFSILKYAPASQASFVVLSEPPDIHYKKKISRYVKDTCYFNLPTWQKYRRSDLIQKLKSPLSTVKRLISFIPAIIKLVRYIKQEQIQIVHTNSGICPVGALASYFVNIPHVWHIRESIGNKSEYPLILGDLLSRFIINLTSEAIICNSKYTSLFFHAKKDNLYIIQNGLENEYFQSIDSKSKGLELKKRLIGCDESLAIGIVGNIIPLKKHNIFLMAAEKINKSYPDCFFFIFGSLEKDKIHQNPIAQSLYDKAIEMGIDNKIIWVDFINHIPSIFHSIDILIHPASFEGSGRVVMEAMSSGKSVIGINSGGVKELIKNGETGYLVSTDDVDDIVNKVQFLIKNPKEKVLLEQRALEFSTENFSNEYMINSIIAIYKNIKNQC